MNEDVLVSVIVPVYNVAGYLDACLESVVAQSHRQLEVIVVDDGSTDGSSDLCDRWARRDPRITVIHQANGGLSAARNTGLDHMSGAVVTMVDSDDLLHPDMIATLLEVMNRHDADIAVTTATRFADGAPPALPAHADARGTVAFERDEALQAIYYQEALDHSAWGRLYRATLWERLRYPVGVLYEDLAVSYDLYSRARRVTLTPAGLYGYRLRATSILGHYNARRLDVLDITDRLERRVARDEPALLPAVRSRRLSARFNLLLLADGDPEVTARCMAVIKQLRGGCLLDRRVRAKNRIGILASYLGPRAVRLLARLAGPLAGRY